MIDKMADILDGIGLIKFLLLEVAYLCFIFKIFDMKEKVLNNYLKVLGICFVILVISVIMYFIFSIFNFQTGMNFLVYIALLTIFLIGIPLILLLSELFGES